MSDTIAPSTDTDERNVQLFHKLLIPDIFSKILRSLTSKERLNMRLCSRATEEAVALSDMYIDGNPGIIYISSGERRFKVHLGLKKSRQTLKLRQSFEEGSLEEIARVRERLCTRVFTKYVDIANVNFNKVPVALIERILDGCHFEELEMKISRENFNDEVFGYLDRRDHKTCRKIKLTLVNVDPDEYVLLSLKPMQELILKTVEDLESTYFAEDMLIEMVKRRHLYLNIPIIVTFEHVVLDVKKIIEDFPEQQSVKFAATTDTVERFMSRIGFRMVKNARDRRDRHSTFSGIVKMGKLECPEPCEEIYLNLRRFAEIDEWSGDFDLVCAKVCIVVCHNALGGMYTIQISNFHCPSDSSEDTVADF